MNGCGGGLWPSKPSIYNDLTTLWNAADYTRMSAPVDT
jgi:hypothetical protein